MRPAGIAKRTKGKVSAVCSNPVSPSPAPSSSTATIGAAASATCSADCAARLDQARRVKAGDSLSCCGGVTGGSLALAGEPRGARGDALSVPRHVLLEDPMTSASGILSGDRVRLRRWRAEDRASFAAMNADARVMEFFAAPLHRSESDALVDRIEAHFAKHHFGLWAVEVPGVA